MNLDAIHEMVEGLKRLAEFMTNEQFDEAEELIVQLEEKYEELSLDEEREKIQESKAVRMVTDCFYIDKEHDYGISDMFGIDGIEITRTEEGKFSYDSTLKMMCNYSENQRWEEAWIGGGYENLEYHSGEMVIIFAPYDSDYGYDITEDVGTCEELILGKTCIVGEDVWMISVPIPYGEEEYMILSQELVEFIEEKGSGILGIGLTKNYHLLTTYGSGFSFYAQYKNVSIDSIDMK